ncbi:hypothetical protein BR63_12895 [Thermanaerosceptrum fracticalcis]|uniref:Peptidase MA-like domain-containing protein n=2 Tax=Thermanaerosceptrum fracticalcis TaxID=1712410 RepID=A0A7G6E4X3_THEFR|nr:hypothetical protein BR63_12895 [Thermanaerosceptrum fracticalcis]
MDCAPLAERRRKEMANLATVNNKSVIAVLIFFIIVSSFTGRGWAEIRTLPYQILKKGISLYVNYQTKDFEVKESHNFIVKYTSADADMAGLITETAETYYHQVGKYLGYNPPAQKIPLIIYPDSDSFNDSFGMKGDKSAVGVYWAGSIRLLSPHAWLPRELPGPEREVLFKKDGPLSHELTHLFIDYQTKGNYTRWLTEGIAQYVEREITGFTLDEPLRSKRSKLYPLTSLDGEFDQQPDQILAYWQSLKTVDYLIDHYGPEKIHELLKALAQGFRINEAFSKVYGINLSTLEKNVKDYIDTETI